MMTTRKAGAEDRRSEGRRSWLPELAVAAAASLALIFFVVRPYVAESFVITADSMAPTLETGDRVLANKLAYRIGDPERGDVAAFQSSDDGLAGQVLIKRVVAVSGDTVEFRGGTLRVNGRTVKEPYVGAGSPPGASQGPLVVPEGSVFVMGDNRQSSMDSRDYGPVSEEGLRGRVLLRFWPLGRFGDFAR